MGGRCVGLIKKRQLCFVLGPPIGLSVCVCVRETKWKKTTGTSPYTKKILSVAQNSRIYRPKRTHSYNRCCCTLCSNIHTRLATQTYRTYVQAGQQWLPRISPDCTTHLRKDSHLFFSQIWTLVVQENLHLVKLQRESKIGPAIWPLQPTSDFFYFLSFPGIKFSSFLH